MSDNIHLGSRGIVKFAEHIRDAILGTHIDTRNYASVVQSNDGMSHLNDDIIPS